VADAQAESPAAAVSSGGAFERDTAVRLEQRSEEACRFGALVSGEWRAGRGPHGGYLAAMILRALTEAIAQPARAPRSLTVHYVSQPQPGPALIETRLERSGRSLSTLSARMEQDGRLVALALSAFSVPWSAPEINEVVMPDVAGADPEREPGTIVAHGGPPFARHIVLQPRIGGMPFADPEQPMELGCWLGLAEARPLDALALAFFSDALIPAPFMRTREPNPAPTIDLTVHFRVALPREGHADPHEMCFARIRGGVIQEGFFDEDSVIWAADGTVLAQSHQLALLLPLKSS